MLESVDIDQAALRLQGKTTEFVRYPAESSHGLSRTGPPDLARLLPALAGVNVPLTGASSLLDVPVEALAALASSAFDWGSAVTSGAGAALLTGLVLLTGAAFGGLAQLLRPGVVESRP